MSSTDNAVCISAEQLLREVHTETLQQFLVSCHNESHHQILQIPILDSYIKDGITGGQKMSPGSVLDIRGPSGSGKTHLLYFLLATCVLPKERNLGWGKAAFVFDMDGSFRISRFREILIARLEQKLPPSAITLTIADNALSRLRIFQPVSTDQLDITLELLPKYHAKFFPDLDLGMIVIHSVDAFYWLDRFKLEQIRPAAFSAALKNSTVRKTMSILHKHLLSYGVTIITTDWIFGGQHTTSDYSEYSNSMRQLEATGSGRSGTDVELTNINSISTSLYLQIILKPGEAFIGDGSPMHEIRAVSRTPHRSDQIPFKLYITRQGIFPEVPSKMSHISNH